MRNFTETFIQNFRKWFIKMRKTQQKKRGKLKQHRKKAIKKVLNSLPLGKNRWVARKKTISPYPYLITISYYQSNVFFTIADIKGHTKG